jgi:hypothetical protein
MLRFTSATCVYFYQDDNIGKFLAYVSLAPYMAVFFAAAVAYTKRYVLQINH